MKRAAAHCRGFTLVEVLIGSSLAGIVMLAVLSSFVFLGRNLTRLANHQLLENKSREALGYLSRDLAVAEAVKSGTAPTAATLTLKLPDGDVTYTYDAGAFTLRRQATFGANQDSLLLKAENCRCMAFAFDYFTSTGDAPTSQIAGGGNVPYSIKQIQACFTLRTPAGISSGTDATYEMATARYVIRNKRLPTGS